MFALRPSGPLQLALPRGPRDERGWLQGASEGRRGSHLGQPVWEHRPLNDRQATAPRLGPILPHRLRDVRDGSKAIRQSGLLWER